MIKKYRVANNEFVPRPENPPVNTHGVDWVRRLEYVAAQPGTWFLLADDLGTTGFVVRRALAKRFPRYEYTVRGERLFARMIPFPDDDTSRVDADIDDLQRQINELNK